MGRLAVKCALCDDEAVCRFAFPRGCLCRPDDREQALCLHHLVKSEPLGGMTLAEDYTVGAALTAWLAAGMPYG